MTKYRIFVSGVQKELKKERFAVKELITQNTLLKKYFDAFLFEDLPAKNRTASEIYLKEVDESDIYLGIFGQEYGPEGDNGLSPTESEFHRAVERDNEILIFLKGSHDSKRDKKLRNFINEIKKPGSGYVYKRFESLTNLNDHVFNSLVVFLEEKGVISKFPFDSMICRD